MSETPMKILDHCYYRILKNKTVEAKQAIQDKGKQIRIEMPTQKPPTQKKMGR